jgi:hypothetical protein
VRLLTGRNREPLFISDALSRRLESPGRRRAV